MQSYGGVGRNVAEALGRLQDRSKLPHTNAGGVMLVTAVGHDDAGDALLSHVRDVGVDVSQVVRVSPPQGRTAS